MDNSEDVTLLSTNIVNQYDKLRKAISKNGKFYDGANDIDLAELYDKLYLIKHQISSKFDGRPQPLDFSSEYYDKDAFEPGAPQAYKESVELQVNIMREWAQCYSPGHKEIASLGQTPFSMENLKLIEKWIAAVIAWHESHEIEPLSKTKK